MKTSDLSIKELAAFIGVSTDYYSAGGSQGRDSSDKSQDCVTV